MVDEGLSKRSMSYIGTSVLVSFKAYSRTICQDVPAAGCQKMPVVAFVLFEIGGDGVVEPPPEFPVPWSLIPSPNPSATTIITRARPIRSQIRF